MSRVPNVYHFVFGLKPQTEPFHLMHYLCLASCIRVNRPQAVLFHCQHEPWGEYWERVRPALMVRPIAPDPYIASFRYRDPQFEPYRYAHLADVARLEVMIEHGGIYADMDTLFVAPLPPAFFERSFIMGAEPLDDTRPEAREIGGSLCNAWMMGEPGAPFARAWLSRLRASFDGSWNAHSALLPFRLSRERPDWLHIEPQRSFFHFGWDRDGLSGMFGRSVGDLDGVHSIHLWSHCWWNADVREFSPFHAGRLTPAYVRHAGTTYARLARNFLTYDLGRQDFPTWRKERLRAAFENQAWRIADLPGRALRRVRGRG